MKREIALIPLLVFAGCSACDKSNSAGGSASNNGAAGDIFTKAISGWDQVKSFRAKMTRTGLSAGNAETSMEAMLPDKFHITTGQSEMIIIGPTTYLKLPNGDWRKITTGLDNSFGVMKKMMDDLKVSKEIKMIGSETLDGVATTVYESKTTMPLLAGPAPDPQPQTVSSKIWVGVSDGMPRKVETGSSSSPVRMTVTYTDYNANIGIEPPIN